MESQGSSLKPQVPPPKCPEEQGVQSPVVERGCSRINSPHMDPSELTEKTKRCKLVWPDQSCEVARGRAFIPVAGQPTILHSKQLGENILKVSIDTIVEENGKVPFPTEEVPYLSDNALGNIVAWPKDKVIFEPGVVPSSKRAKKALFKPKVQDKFQPKPQYPAMDKCESLMATVDDFVLKIDIPKAVVQHSHKLEIRKDDLVSWLARGELDGVHISMYIKYLYDKYEPSLCKFLCPSRVAYVARSSDDLTLDCRVRYMASSFREPSGCLWLVPYHEGSLKMLKAKNRNLTNVDNQNITWELIKCPEQLDGISCGIYVFRFMRDIIRAGVTEIPNAYLPTSPQSYKEADIFEVIEECVNYLQPFLQLELSLPQHI